MPTRHVLAGRAIAVPGELRGLALLHRRHGSLPWANLVHPSVALARDGFRVAPYLARAIQEKAGDIRARPHVGHALTRDHDGVTLLREGDVMVRERYAKTLEAIMHAGGRRFVHGSVGRVVGVTLAHHHVPLS